MSEFVTYELARYDGLDDGAELLERIQLVSIEGVLQLRDASTVATHGAGTDVIAVISSMPALREIRDQQQTRITCIPEIVAQLPLVLEPVTDGDDLENFSAEVNGEPWCAFRTADEGFAMLPGWSSDDGPTMDPCWAEFQVGEGEDNPLVGWGSIGLAMPGVTVEYALYDHGGWGSTSAVAIRPLNDFAEIFVDWLLNIKVLSGLWGGDCSPKSPGIGLFETAAAAANRTSSWSTEDADEESDDDDDDEDDDDDDEEDDYEVGNYGWMRLKLHLSDALIEEVRGRLRKSANQAS
jgi:hypothetical protein